jgi:hypothetical protein
VRVLVALATFQLARLEAVLDPYGYVWLLTGWVLVCAVLTTRPPGHDVDRDLASYFGGPRERAT